MASASAVGGNNETEKRVASQNGPQLPHYPYAPGDEPTCYARFLNQYSVEFRYLSYTVRVNLPQPIAIFPANSRLVGGRCADTASLIVLLPAPKLLRQRIHHPHRRFS